QLYWFVDGAYLGSSDPSSASSWRPTRPGTHQLRVVDDQGRSVALQVQLAREG
ncbi:MAG: hypothetical protein KDI56_11535, partial [Xanthomonadales bacterium]|nr:hypothetical protein [Xanthomonadales bacterium]